MLECSISLIVMVDSNYLLFLIPKITPFTTTATTELFIIVYIAIISKSLFICTTDIHQCLRFQFNNFYCWFYIVFFIHSILCL